MTLSNKEKMDKVLSDMEKMSAEELLQLMKSKGFNPSAPSEESRHYQIIENSILNCISSDELRYRNRIIDNHSFAYASTEDQDSIIDGNDYAEAA